MLLLHLFVLLLRISQVQADPIIPNVKGVFAHFMVGNTETYSAADWQNDISLAKAARFDGFAMNMARGETTNGAQLAAAFAAANLVGGFKLFFSFDYAGNGIWLASDVIALINKYQNDPAYYKRGTAPLVSTFEGPAASGDWPGIKSATGCFFIPSWSSLGARPAWGKNVANGLFSWAAWPTGPNNMNTFTDASYFDTLNGAPYMMPVSPFFYTNMPGFRKNWMWRGQHLWFDRWVHVTVLQPEYVQVISWNDYGESHHIGPLRANAYAAFGETKGRSPIQYQLGKPHDGLRTFLPYLIEYAKTGSATITQENVVAWFRPSPKGACGTGGTTGNTASQLQEVFSPADIVLDQVHFAALLTSPGTVTVTIGGEAVTAVWGNSPSNGIGLFRGSAGFDGKTGQVVVTITRASGNLVASGGPISSACEGSITNWNSFVIQGVPKSVAAASPIALSNPKVGCVEGFGDPKYRNLCTFACKYDYCPKGACTCTKIDVVPTRPTSKNLFACPAPGIDATYLGLCAMVCNYIDCPDVCKIAPAGTVCVAPLPVAPPIPRCEVGSADGKYAGLCSYSCKYGFCPPEICTCTQAGSSAANEPATTGMSGTPKAEIDYGLCKWNCEHGNCPSDLCNCSGTGCANNPTGPGILFETFNGPLGPSRALVDRSLSALGQYCHPLRYCYDQTSALGSTCVWGNTKIGSQRADCQGPNRAMNICCSLTSFRPEDCTWRDGGLVGGGLKLLIFCNGQCLDGETEVTRSSWGNLNLPACPLGTAAFCCGTPTIKKAVEGCRWATCEEAKSGITCPLGSVSKGLKRVWPCFASESVDSPTEQHYCCPIGSPIDTCDWKGSGADCSDNKCEPYEVRVGEYSFVREDSGDFLKFCPNGEKHVGCCTVKAPVPKPVEPSVENAECRADNDICNINEELCIDDDNEFTVPSPRIILPKRDLNSTESLSELSERFSELSIRAPPTTLARGGTIRQVLPQMGPLVQQFQSMPYWGRGPFIVQMNLRQLIFYTYEVGRLCTDVSIYQSLASGGLFVASWMENDHVFDLQGIMAFAEFMVYGKNVAGTIKSSFPLVDANWVNLIFNQNSLPRNTLPLINGLDWTKPVKRVFEQLGSISNPNVMALLTKNVNRIKGAVIAGKVPYNLDNFKAKIDALILQGGLSPLFIEEWFFMLRDTVAVFSYLRSSDIAARLDLILAGVRSELVLIETYAIGWVGAAIGLAVRWDEFIVKYLINSALLTRQWLLDACNIVIDRYILLAPDSALFAMSEVKRITDAIQEIYWPGFDPRNHGF